MIRRGGIGNFAKDNNSPKNNDQNKQRFHERNEQTRLEKVER